MTGQGVTRDYVEAVKWFRKAADQGDADSQCKLGICYECEQNYEEAIKWFRKAAEQNFDDAQRCLGDCYERGNGVARNLGEAYKWYNLAAAQGNEAAKKAISMMVPKEFFK